MAALPCVRSERIGRHTIHLGDAALLSPGGGADSARIAGGPGQEHADDPAADRPGQDDQRRLRLRARQDRRPWPDVCGGLAVHLAMVAMGGAMALALGKSVKDWAASGDELQKMAFKRAFVAAALTLSCASQIFTQDLEDIENGDDSYDDDDVINMWTRCGLDVYKCKEGKIIK